MQSTHLVQESIEEVNSNLSNRQFRDSRYFLGHTFITWGTKICAGVQQNTGGYRIYMRGTFSKLLPRIVSIITTKPKNSRYPFGCLEFFYLRWKGLEQLNATVRWTVAADGSTEANLYLLPLGADANESLPAYERTTVTLIHVAVIFFLWYNKITVVIVCHFLLQILYYLYLVFSHTLILDVVYMHIAEYQK